MQSVVQNSDGTKTTKRYDTITKGGAETQSINKEQNNMDLPKSRYGDVFEIKTAKGVGYFQCVKEASATDVEVIRVFSSIFSSVDEVNFES